MLPWCCRRFPAELCAATSKEGFTVVVDSSGRFHHCRGRAEADTAPVSGEQVFVQLPPVDPRQPYRYRLYDPKKPPTAHPRRLFRQQLELLGNMATELRALTSGAEGSSDATEEKAPAKTSGRIADLPLPTALSGATPQLLHETAVRRDDYVSASPPAFSDALKKLRPLIAGSSHLGEDVEAACATKETAIAPGPLHDDVAAHCAKITGEKDPLASLKSFAEKVDALTAARRAARAALGDLSLRPITGAEQDAAAKVASAALVQAIAATKQVTDAAPGVAEDVSHFARSLRFLQIALSVPATSVEGQRIDLGRFSSGGIISGPAVYQVHIWREPSPLFDLDNPAEVGTEAQPSGESIVDRFEPIERRFFTVEVALTFSGGLPDHPDLTGQLGHQGADSGSDSGLLGRHSRQPRAARARHAAEPLVAAAAVSDDHHSVHAEPAAQLLHRSGHRLERHRLGELRRAHRADDGADGGDSRMGRRSRPRRSSWPT